MVTMMENRKVGYLLYDIDNDEYIDKEDCTITDLFYATPFENKEDCLEYLKNSDIFDIDKEFEVFEYELMFNTYKVEVNFELNPDK